MSNELPDLEDMPWSEIVPRLTLFAVRLLKKKGKDGFVPLAPDYAHTAIERVLEGNRRWNKQKNPDFFLFLTSVVSSLVSHEEIRSRRQSPLDDVPEEKFSTDPFDTADKVLENVEVRKFLSFVRDQDRELHQFAVLIWLKGETDIEKQANQLRVSQDEIPRLRRRLRRKIEQYRTLGSEGEKT